MRVLIMGCNGYVGSAVARRLKETGHSVTGLARDAETNSRIVIAGFQALPGKLDALSAIAESLQSFDAIVFAPFVPFDDEPPIIGSLLDLLNGTGRTLLYTSGTGVLSIPARAGEWHQENFEEDDSSYRPRHWLSKRIETENAVRTAATRGVRGIVIRPPLIWGRGGSRQVPAIFESIAKTGTACYVGAGLNLYSHVYIDDLAELYRLALEKGKTGALYHAVAGEVNWKALAEAVGRTMGCSAKSVSYEQGCEIWGELVADLYFGVSSRSRAVRSRVELGWAPSKFDLVEDIRSGSYRERYRMSAEIIP